jgi:hypothetical protein
MPDGGRESPGVIERSALTAEVPLHDVTTQDDGTSLIVA